MKNLFVLVLLMLSSLKLYSQIKLDAEIRPRTEYRNGYKKAQAVAGERPEFVTTQRTGFGVLFQSKVTGYINLRGARTWGESGTKQDISTIHLKEGWIEVPLINHLTAKIGRQVLKYDNQRILAATNWNQIGTQHDLLLLKYQQDKLSIHSGMAYNNESSGQSFERYYPVPYYKMLFLGWANYSFSDKVNLSLLAVGDANQKENTTKNFTRYTYGGTAIILPTDNLKFNVTGYLQSGFNPSGVQVKANMATFRGDFNFSSKSGMFFGADYFSGKNPNDSTGYDKVFNNLYGSKHKYLGYMDYFPTNKSGIVDGFIGLNLKALKQTHIELALHNFWLPHKYTVNDEQNTIIDSFLGTEIDAKVDYRLSENTSLSFIYSMIFSTTSMDYVKGGDHNQTNNYAMIMLTWKPEFEFKQ